MVLIEAAMFVALGFCIAGLLSIVVLSAVWRRAVRLTRRAVTATAPLSMADTRAEIDALRADHAVQVCRLEKSIERLQQEVTASRIARTEAEKAATNTRRTLEDRDQALMDAAELERTLRRTIADQEAALAAANVRIRNLERDIDGHLNRYAELEARLSAAAETTSEDDVTPAEASVAEASAIARTAALESEVANLRRRLRRAEDALHNAQAAALRPAPESTRDERIKTLDSKLLDMETRYIAAQAEIARLSLELDNRPGTQAATAENSDQLRALEAENDALRAELASGADFETLRKTLKALAAEVAADLADEEDLFPIDGASRASFEADPESLAGRILVARKRQSPRSQERSLHPEDEKRKVEA